MNDLEALFRFLRQHLVQTAFAVFVAASILRAIVQAARDDPSRRRPLSGPEPRTPQAELHDRVRRGFEEMMRRRAAAQTPATPKPPAAARASATSRPYRPEVTHNAPVPRPTPPSTPSATPSPVPRAVSQAAAAARERIARLRGPHPLQSIASRVLGDPRSLRRALLTREILDAPLALRDPR